MFNLKCIDSKLINATKSLCLKLNLPQKMVSRNCTIRRAILYVPCRDKRKIETAFTVKIDSLALDLDTDIEEEQKNGRETLHDLLNERTVTFSDPEWCVKVNPIQTGQAFKLDIDAIFSAKQLPAGIILPDVDSIDILHWFAGHIWTKLVGRPEEDRKPIQLLVTIGSPRGVMLLQKICEKIVDLSKMAPITPSAIIFDHISFIESLGCTQTSHGIEYLYARQKTVLVGKAFGLQVIDQKNENPVNVRNLERECREGFCMGFTGKQAVFPLQVPIIQKEFTPTRTRVTKAKRLIREMRSRDLTKLDDFTPERIPMEDPVLKVAEHTVKTAIYADKIKEEE